MIKIKSGPGGKYLPLSEKLKCLSLLFMSDQEFKCQLGTVGVHKTKLSMLCSDPNS